jgi:hypothetical protein
VFKVRAKNSKGWGSYSIVNQLYDIVRTEPLAPLTVVTEGSLTDDSQLHILWSAVTDQRTGYDSITAYEIYWDNGSNGVDWTLVHKELYGSFTFEFVIQTGIIRSRQYKFKYKAVNQQGEGSLSSTSTIEASGKP